MAGRIPILSQETRLYLRSLQGTKEWVNLLASLRALPLPNTKYRPSAEDEHRIVNRMIYESGRLKEREFLLSLITGDEDE